MFCSALGFSASKSNSAILAYNQAVTHANAGEWNAASDAASAALSADSDFAQAYYLRGVARYSLKASDNAMLDLGDALRRDSGMVDARALRGLIHYEADRYDAALEDVNAVLLRQPEHTQSLLIRGIIRLKREELPGASHDLRAFVRLKPNDPMVAKLKEVLASLQGRREEVSDSEPVAAVPTRKKTRNPEATPSVLSRSLSEEFGRRLLRGDATPVAGDIQSRKSTRGKP